MGERQRAGMTTTEAAPYERSPAWQACYELARACYRVTASWPRAELFGLVAQVRRAAYSAPANIAEGMARRGPRELRRFLDIALGSLAELDVGLRLARDTGMLDHAAWADLEVLRRTAGRLAGGLARSVRG